MFLYAHLHSFNMCPCAVETSLQQKLHQSPAGEWNGREMRISIWFMFTSFGLIDREDIFISMFVKAFHRKRIRFLDLLIWQFEGFIFRFERKQSRLLRCAHFPSFPSPLQHSTVLLKHELELF